MVSSLANRSTSSRGANVSRFVQNARKSDIGGPQRQECEHDALRRRVEFFRELYHTFGNPTSRSDHLALARKLECYGYKEAAQSERIFGTDN